MEPLVSICCTAYNQEKYIAQTLDCFLAQQCDFSYEILIHDDASADRTPDIIRDYAARYPDAIFPVYQQENQYSKGLSIDGTFNFPRARGRYIALCEGDDFWCDPCKLQRQITYMEAHPECTFSFTNGYVHDESGEKPDRPGESEPAGVRRSSGIFQARAAYAPLPDPEIPGRADHWFRL